MKVVLVVDDEPGIANLVRNLLLEEGYSVRTAASGAEALDILATERIDLVVLDLLMPHVDGWTVLERMHEAPDAPPVAVLSAVFEGDAIDRAKREFGARAYIAKPFRIRELMDTISGILPAN